jgi:hypothetical protein
MCRTSQRRHSHVDNTKTRRMPPIGGFAADRSVRQHECSVQFAAKEDTSSLPLIKNPFGHPLGSSRISSSPLSPTSQQKFESPLLRQERFSCRGDALVHTSIVSSAIINPEVCQCGSLQNYLAQDHKVETSTFLCNSLTRPLIQGKPCEPYACLTK